MSSIKKIVFTGLFLALGQILPFLTSEIPQIDMMMLPVYIPVFLCGYICGWSSGLVVGLITPLMRSILFGMPPMYPNAVAMAFELAMYGLLAGILCKLFPQKRVFTYITMIIAMLCGRTVWGIVRVFQTGVACSFFTWAVFMFDALFYSVISIIVQVALIPFILIALMKTKIIP